MRTLKRLKGRFVKRSRLRRALTWLFIFIILALGGAYYYISRPHRLAAIAGGVLQEMTGAQVHIDRATISLNGNIDVTGVRLTVPGIEGQGAELFAAEQVIMRVDLRQVLRGKVTAQQMILVRPVVALTEVADNSFNFELLRKQRDDQKKDLDIDLPRVYVREGRLRYGEVHEGRYQSTGELLLSGGLTPDMLQRRLYHFELFQYNEGKPDVASGPTLNGQLDMIALEVKAELAHFAFADPHRNILPRQIRKWWDLFDPNGSMPNIKFDYDPRLGPQGEVRLDGLSITLPQLSESDYQVRMTDVRGTFHFDAERIRIRELVGRIEGLEYRINGQIDGYSAEAPFNLALNTKPFRIPEQPRYMVALPVPVQKGFRLLTPVGWLRVSVAAVRNKLGGEVAYQGSATILSGVEVLQELVAGVPREDYPSVIGNLTPDSPELISKGMYRKFAYELSHCRGKLTFNSDLITVNNLTGQTPGGGTATIEGTIGPPGEDAAVELTVTAVGVPFDEQLKSALPADQRKYLDMFFHAPSYQRLLDAGYFVTPEHRSAEAVQRAQLTGRLAQMQKLGHVASAAALETELERLKQQMSRPVFDLSGRGDVLVKIHRSPGKDQPIDLHTAIDLAGVNVLFEYFPYPIRVRSGRLVIAPQAAEFDNVTADGLYGGEGSLSGVIGHEKIGGVRDVHPDLRLKASGLALGPLMYDVIGQPRDQWLKQLRLTGLIDVDGRIHRSERRTFDLALDLKLRDGSARPGEGEYELSGLDGDLHLSLDGLTMKRVTGRHNNAVIELNGEVAFDKAAPSLAINANATGLQFQDAVLDLIAPAGGAAELRRLWAQRQPAGSFDANATYRVDGDREPKFTVTLKPHALSFLHEGNRLSLDKVGGQVHVAPGAVQLKQLSGDYDGGRLELHGRVLTSPSIQAELSLRATGHRFSPTLRHAMPPAVAKLLTAIELDGQYELSIPRLVYAPSDNAPATAHFDASVKLTDASGRIGLPFSGLTGRIDARLAAESAGEQPALDVLLVAQKVRLADRDLQNLHMPMRSVAGSDALVIPELRGECYGGQIGGSGAANLDSGDFHLQLALSQAQLARLMTPAPPLQPLDEPRPNPPAQHIAGEVSASLAIEGNLKQPDQIRGRGDILVRNGSFVGVPLGMGILRVMHLQLPGATRFQSAAISYYIREGRTIFERVELSAPNMTLGGGGAIDYATGAIDITLTTSNPRGLDLGPLTDLINRARDQLVTIRIGGTLATPSVNIRQFNGLTQAWEDVFGAPGN